MSRWRIWSKMPTTACEATSSWASSTMKNTRHLRSRVSRTFAAAWQSKSACFANVCFALSSEPVEVEVDQVRLEERVGEVDAAREAPSPTGLPASGAR